MNSGYSTDESHTGWGTLMTVTLRNEDVNVLCRGGSHLISVIFCSNRPSPASERDLFYVFDPLVGRLKEKLNGSEFTRRFSILYIIYRTVGLALYWESVITVRRMLLAALN